MRILIAGLGSAGRRHLGNLIALGMDDLILYRTGNSTLPEEDLESFRVENDLQKALAHHPDAVVVSNPTALHLEVAIPAVEAGCHLFIEKPISHTIDRVDRLAELLIQRGLIGYVGFQFRFHPGLQLIKGIIEEGRIGRPISAQAHYGEYLPDWHPWEDYRQSYSARSDLGGGVVRTLCHPFDYLRWFFGEVRDVFASVGRSGELQIDVEDAANILLEFENDILGSVHLDYLQRPPSHRLEIIGTEGTIRWDYEEGTTQIFDVNRGEWELVPLPPGFERNDLFLNEMKNFLMTLAGEQQAVSTLDDGVANLRIALACLESSALNASVDPKTIS